MAGWLVGDNGRLTWALMCSLLTLQYLLFHGYAEREIVWAYPTNHDQAGYLLYVYTLWLRFLERGIAELFEAMRQPPANGILLQIEGVIMCLLFGAKRISCLTLNFLHFAALQVSVFMLLRWLTGNTWLGFMGVGLVLSQHTAFLDQGGLFDFRLDFAAYCLFGIWVVAVMRSRIFEDRKWILISAVVAACLILLRFFAVTYVIGVLGLIGLYFAGILARYRFSPPADLCIKKRLVNMVLFGLTVSACVGPIILLARKAIWAYYHEANLFTGPEKSFMYSMYGITDEMSYLTYYPKSLWDEHLGLTFVYLSLLLVGVAFLVSRFETRKELPAPRRNTDLSSSIGFLIACIAIPLTILTTYTGKATGVVGITGVPVAVLSVLMVACVGGPLISDCHNSSFKLAGCLTLALLSLSVGGWNYCSHLTAHGPLHCRRSEINELINVYDSVGTYCKNVGWDIPNLSINTDGERLGIYVLAVMFFERTGQLVDFKKHMRQTLSAVTKEQFLQQLSGTDVLIIEDLQEHPKKLLSPFDASMIPLSDHLRKWGEEHLVELVKKTSLHGAGCTVYVRPSMRILGLDKAGCVTEHPVWLSGDARIVQQRPLVSLRGRTHHLDPSKSPNVLAEAITDHGRSMELPAKLISEGNACTIKLDFRTIQSLGLGRLIVQLRFYQETDAEGERDGSSHGSPALCGFESIKLEAMSQDWHSF